MTGATTIGADVIILGAGIAGASLAAELAPRCRVVLLEAEDRPDRHSTGRSAAVFLESYGNATVRGLTRASRSYLHQPPAGFTEVPLAHPRSAMFVADGPRLSRLEQIASMADPAMRLRRLDAGEALRHCPLLDRHWVAGAMLDSSGQDLDVAALHHGYLRIARRHSSIVVYRASDPVIERDHGRWCVRSSAGEYVAPVLVNAAGAWADEVAQRAGVAPIGLQPLRRTVVMLPAPTGVDVRVWPMVMDVDEKFYFKPDAGQILLSPANEDPSPPGDVVPDELDVATAVDRFETATTVEVRRINHRWAGLRNFVADRSPVAGFDVRAEGFFWLAGQGGYGIQMAPALARTAAALISGREVPGDVLAEGVTAEALSPFRLSLCASGHASA